MRKSDKQPIAQHDFLQEAMNELGLNRDQFAERIGCPPTTFKKWMASPEAIGNYREMNSTAWALVREVIAHERLKIAHEKLANENKK